METLKPTSPTTANPPTGGPPAIPAAVPVTPSPKRDYHIILILLLPLVAIVGSYFLFRTKEPQTIVPGPLSTPPQAPIATQNPGRSLSAVATQSAYLQLEQQVVDLSTQISQTAPQDVHTAPPSLILPLGFK